MNILPLFPSNVIVDSINKNTDQLKNNTIFHPTNDNYDPTKEIELDFKALKRYPHIEKIIIDIFKESMSDLYFNNDFKISTSWFTTIEKGEIGHYHIHKNCFYSGVYYYDEYTENSGQLEFENPLTYINDFHLVPDKHTPTNSDSISISIKNKMIIFFPSYLRHRISRHNGDKTRKSLAFNIIPVGEYGQGDSTYNTVWT